MSFRWKDTTLSDEGIKADAKAIQDMCKDQEGAIESYIHIIQTICNECIISGTTHDAFESYSQAVSRLKGKFESISYNTAMQYRYYLEAIDQADQFLY